MAHGHLHPHGGFMYLDWVNGELVQRFRVKAWCLPDEDGVLRDNHLDVLDAIQDIITNPATGSGNHPAKQE